MSKEVYRSAASVLLLRPAPRNPGKYQVLLLHKPRRRDSWQLPQGGREEGENFTEAAMRELHEEAGIKNATVLGESSEVYQYDFPTSYRKFRPDHVRGQRIEFVYALTSSDTEVIVDGNEINRFIWVYPEQIRQYLKRKEYVDLVMKVLEEAKKVLGN